MLKKERSFTSCHLLNIICLPCSTSLSLSLSLSRKYPSSSCRFPERPAVREITRFRCFTRGGWRTRITHRPTSRWSPPLNSISGICYAPESSSCCTSSRHPRRFRKPARARSKLFPWLQLLRSVTLRPSIYKPTGWEICANCVETERFNRWEIRRSNWSVSVLLYCRLRISRTPLCTGEILHFCSSNSSTTLTQEVLVGCLKISVLILEEFQPIFQ